MDLKTKRLLLKTFYGFIRMVYAIAGVEGVHLVDDAFQEWRAARIPEPKTTKKRANRKKS